jgi:hypothetical protein
MGRDRENREGRALLVIAFSFSQRHSGTRAKLADPESSDTICVRFWIPGSPLRGAPE